MFLLWREERETSRAGDCCARSGEESGGRQKRPLYKAPQHAVESRVDKVQKTKTRKYLERGSSRAAASRHHHPFYSYCWIGSDILWLIIQETYKFNDVSLSLVSVTQRAGNYPRLSLTRPSSRLPCGKSDSALIVLPFPNLIPFLSLHLGSAKSNERKSEITSEQHRHRERAVTVVVVLPPPLLHHHSTCSSRPSRRCSRPRHRASRASSPPPSPARAAPPRPPSTSETFLPPRARPRT